jgi:hypothetical protein
MKYSTRKQARNVATLLNSQNAGLVVAPTQKNGNGWQIKFKRGLLTLKKGSVNV